MKQREKAALMRVNKKIESIYTQQLTTTTTKYLDYGKLS